MGVHHTVPCRRANEIKKTTPHAFCCTVPLFCVPKDTVPEAFGAALRADEAPPCVHKRRDVVHERDLVIRDVTAREELPAQHGKGPDVALFAVPGKGGVSQAVKRKQGAGSFLDFVRRSGTARTTHPRGAYVRTCGELNDIDLPAIRPLLNASITYLPPRYVQQFMSGGKSDFGCLPARTPHGVHV